MDISCTKQEMAKRYRLICDIMCLCAELTEEDTLEDFGIEWYDFQEELNLPEENDLVVDIDYEDKQVTFSGISFNEENCLFIDYQSRFSTSVNAMWCKSQTLETIKEYVEKYAKAMNDESK